MSQAGSLLALLGLTLAVLAILLWRHSIRQREALGLPAGRIVSVDTGDWQACARTLYSARYRLCGKPDYLVRVGSSMVPVEVKPGRRAAQPYASDILQLGAYLLLVEEDMGRRPPYGYLCYAAQRFEIPNSHGLRQQVIAGLGEMQRLRSARRVLPQHDDPARCLRCGHHEHCAAALA